MATLNSPGVAVSVVNESFYTQAAPGTIPLIFVASASNKKNPSGVTAPGTLPSNAGKIWTVTGQRDLADTFGVPVFYTDASGNPVHGGELNEYGLQAAYSLLGVSSQAYVVRAGVDLSGLTPQSSTPSGAPKDGAYWVDTSNSQFGIFEWGSTGAFKDVTPLIIDDSNAATQFDSINQKPKASFGVVGSYAVAVNQPLEQVHTFYKNLNGNWVEVGSNIEANFTGASNNTFVSTSWATSWPTATGKILAATSVAGTLIINATTVTVASGYAMADIALAINPLLQTKGVGAKVVGGALALFASSTAKSNGVTADGNIAISGDATLLAQLGLSAKTYFGPTVFVGPHTQFPSWTGSSARPAGSVYVKTTIPNGGAYWSVKQYNATSNAFNLVKSPIYATGAEATYSLDKAGGGVNIPVGTLFIESNYNHGNDSTPGLPSFANFTVQRRVGISPTTITSNVSTTTVALTTGSSLQISASVAGVTGYVNTTTVTIQGTTISDFVAAVNASGIPNINSTINVDGSVSIVHNTGGEILFKDTTNILGTVGFIPSVYNSVTGQWDHTANFYSAGAYEPTGATAKASNWRTLVFSASATSPSSAPANGQLWYSSIVDQVDVMVHDGQKWAGYATVFPNADVNGPIVSATKPLTQSKGTPLADGDIWISTADIEQYGQVIYVYDGLYTLSWILQDPTDQTSPTGWLFADARWATSGDAVNPSSIADLRFSSFVDPDAPDPAEYPRGMRLWNLRRSGFNVKQYVADYINVLANNGINLRMNLPMDGSGGTVRYNANRWISVSPNQDTGAGSFGRHAQRGFVIKGLKSAMDANVSIRDTDTLTYNLIVCPGYPELIQNMISLNADRAFSGFVIGDTPMRLKATGTDLKAWGLNSNGAFDNSDKGGVSYNEYMAMYYPSGYTNDLAGNYIVVPPSHMALRMIVNSDAKSYPWFAPAGIRRGGIDNATSVGYLENGEFKSTALPTGVRDVMASVKINPIATLTGAGIVAMGQYTRANGSSALDRINVSRLVAYLRRQLDVLSRPYLFEPNDKITRNEIKNAVTSLLLELVGQRALYDFIVVCDESNNTPARIDRSELWLDLAIEPVKAVEFIYVPLRIVNTGAIKSGTYTLA
jgi:hypothetical protein